MTPRLARLLVPVLAAMAGLALGEVLLRTVFHVAPQVDLDIYRRDDAGNLRLKPGVDKHHVTPLWDVSVRTNADGWRDESGQSSNEVLGLGDSFAFGWGVEEDEGLYRLLEAELGQKILNAAVPGTSTPDQAQLLETEFSDATPKTVLLAFFVGNDFVEATRGGSQLFAVENGRLTYAQSPGGASAWALAQLRNLRVMQLLRALQFRYGVFNGDGPAGTFDEWMRAFAAIHLRGGDSQSLFGEATEALDRVARWCEQRGCRLLVLVIPRSWQVEEAGLAEMLRELKIDREQLDLDRPQRVLADWGAARGVEVIDFLPALRRAAASDGELRLYHSPDAHWSAAGHALAARAVAEALGETP